MRRRTTGRLAMKWALPIAALLAPIVAVAQETAVTANTIETVTVTSERRSENVQRVPIAVTAFTSKALEVKGINDVQGMSQLTPNVNLDTASPFGGSNQVLSASIRGIGQDDFAMNLDPGVGVYVDGVYFARTVGANVNLLDVERVEILKGPQGTLFGRNTIGGAISVVTRDPGDQLTFKASITGGQFKRRDFQGTADIPLSDNLLTTFTFSSLQRDGYQKRIPFPGLVSGSSGIPDCDATPVGTHCGVVSDPRGAFHEAGDSAESTLGGQGVDVMRAKFLWRAADNFKVTLTGDWTHVDESSVPETLVQTVANFPADFGVGGLFGLFYNACLLGIPFSDGPTPGGVNPPGTTANVCGTRGPGMSGPGNYGVTTGNPGIFGVNADGNQTNNRLPFGPVFLTGNKDTTYANGNNFDKMDEYGTGLTLDWALGDNMSLKSITAYRHLNWKVGLDLDGSPIQFLEPSFQEGQHQVSQELQINGTAWNSHINWVAGLFYMNEEGNIQDYVTFPAGFLQVDGQNLLTTKNYAGYAHMNINFTDQLSLILGGRYSEEKKTFEGFQEDLNAGNYKGGFPPGGLTQCYPVTNACRIYEGFQDPNDPLRYMPPGVAHAKFDAFTPTAGVQYQITPDVMAYYSFSKGTKSGGWTTRLSFPLPTQPAFGPEKAKTHEVGLKTQWFDDRLRLNVAGFITDYEDIQLNFQQGASPTLKNAGTAKIKGIEVEGQAVIGGGFSIAGTFGYMDAYYTELAPGLNAATSPPGCVFQGCITLDSKLPKTPKTKFSLSPQWELPLNNNASVRVAADYTYQSSVYNNAANTQLFFRPNTSVVNGSIAYISPDDGYELIAGGTNLGDERFITTGTLNTAGGAGAATYNPPRQWYVTLRIKR